jgi:hypothetical protein
VERVIEDVFHNIINLVPTEAPSDRGFSRISMELSRDESRGIKAVYVISVRVKPGDVMLLKK